MFSVTEGTYASISGGTINVTAMGDGIDSNGALYVTGGTCYVSGPTNSGNGALDYTSEGSISGGVFAATGSVGMAMSFDSSSAQGVIFYCFDAAQPSGSTFTLTDASGAVLAQFTPDNAYQCVVVSAPELSVGESYTLTTGSEAHTITMDSLSYSNGLQQAGMMGFGGGKGGMAYGDMQPPDGSAPQTEGGMQMPSGNFGGKGAQRP